MHCYEIWINGKRVCVAGAANTRGVQATMILRNASSLFFVRADTEESISPRESFKWLSRELTPSDEVRIKIVESESPDKPESITTFGTKTDTEGRKLLHCSFCGQSEKEAKKMVTGFGANVCSECFKLLAESFGEQA